MLFSSYNAHHYQSASEIYFDCYTTNISHYLLKPTFNKIFLLDTKKPKVTMYEVLAYNLISLYFESLYSKRQEKFRGIPEQL
jgi:hypothetical protein